MGYENNAFPLTSGTAYNQYGARGVEDGLLSGGQLHGVGGSEFETVVYVKAGDFSISGGVGTFSTRQTIKAGFIPREAYFEVTEAFTQTGGTTSVTLSVGTAGSAQTDGFSISDAATSLSTTEEFDTAGAGTWASALANDTIVGVDLRCGGGTMTAIGAGRAKIVIRYTKV